MILLDEIKTALRRTNSSLDENIARNIDACLEDLRQTGVDSEKDSAILSKAVELYCKWQDNFNGQGEMFERNYKDLRDGLSLRGETRIGDGDEG